MLKPYTCPCVLGRIGIWKGLFLERGENLRTQRKTSRRGRKPTTNSYHFIYQKHEKGTPFSRSLPIKAIIGSTGTPLPSRGKGSKCPYHCSTLAEFSASEADSLVVFVFLLYLHKKGSSSMSTSLTHNKYRKIPKISPGAYIFQRPFLRGLFLEGLVFGGAYLRREICVSKSIGLAL